MKTLLIMRHAKSSWKQEGIHDHDRGLNKRGKRDIRRMGELVLDQGLIPELIVTSTAKRACKTARKLAKVVGYEGEIIETGQFYHAPPEDYIEVLSNLHGDFEPIMIVGHNPGLEDLLELITRRAEFIPTATLVHMELPIQHWDEFNLRTRGMLKAIWRPKELTETRLAA